MSLCGPPGRRGCASGRRHPYRLREWCCGGRFAASMPRSYRESRRDGGVCALQPSRSDARSFAAWMPRSVPATPHPKAARMPPVPRATLRPGGPHKDKPIHLPNGPTPSRQDGGGLWRLKPPCTSRRTRRRRPIRRTLRPGGPHKDKQIHVSNGPKPSRQDGGGLWRPKPPCTSRRTRRRRHGQGPQLMIMMVRS